MPISISLVLFGALCGAGAICMAQHATAKLHAGALRCARSAGCVARDAPLTSMTAMAAPLLHGTRYWLATDRVGAEVFSLHWQCLTCPPALPALLQVRNALSSAASRCLLSQMNFQNDHFSLSFGQACLFLVCVSTSVAASDVRAHGTAIVLL